MSEKARRRRWRLVAAVAALGLVAAGIATLAFTSDPTRVVAIAERALARELGLVLRHDGAPRVAYWPRFGVVLRDYRIDVAATARTLASGESLAIEVPWRALGGGALSVERIALDAPVFDAGALEGWQRRADDDDAPLRWPAIGGGIVVRGGRIVNLGAASRAIDAIDVEVSSIEPGAPMSARVGWTPRAEADAARASIAVTIEGVPRNDADGIVLDDATLALRIGDAPRVTLAGELHYGRARWSVDGRLRASALPAAVAGYFVGPDEVEPPTNVELRLTRGADAWSVLAHGLLAGVALDADLRFAAWPDIDAPLPELLESMRRDVAGTARIARLRLGSAVLEDVTLDDDDATETP